VLNLISSLYQLILNLLLTLLGNFSINTSLTLKAKLAKITKCHKYSRQLAKDTDARDGNMFDHHFYRVALYVKFASLLMQIVVDVTLGMCVLYVFNAFSERTLVYIHWYTDGLNLEVMQNQTKWLMGIPLGIKPNHNLSQFIGCAVLDAMGAWEHVTTGLNEA
jgi:hypothetical protein